MRMGAVWRMQMHVAVLFVMNPSLRRAAPHKVEGTDGLDFCLSFINATEIKAVSAEVMRFT